MTRIAAVTTSFVAALVALAGCPRSAPQQPEPPSERREAGTGSAAARGAPERPAPVAESVPLEVVYALADAGDLAAEVRAFPGLERCTATLGQQIAPPMAEVLADIGYNDLALDGCRALEALAERSVDACDRLELRYGRLGCRRRYAMYYGEPDLCPVEPVHDGRDPLCVAVAMRDPSMCLARRTQEEVGVCRAMILRNERPCRVAHDNATAAGHCAVAARRWWAALPTERPRPAVPPGFEPLFEIRLAADDEDAGAAEPARSRLLDRGIVLPADELVLGGRYQPPIGDRPPLLELRLPQPVGELPQTFELAPMAASAWLRLRDAEPVDSSEAVATGTITIDRFTPTRGAIVEGTAALRLQPTLGEPVRVEARFRTFVRDVEGTADANQ